MLARARLRLTALYAVLIGITLALVAGGALALSVRETRRTDDLELRLRAEGVAAEVGRAGAPATAQPGDGRGRREDDEHERLERQGILTYVLPVVNGSPAAQPGAAFAGLPSVEQAAAALAAGAGRYGTVTLDQGEVRVYSLPVTANGRTVAVVQVARSRYFVDRTVTRLLLTMLGMGAAGLALSAAAGYWLAGRALLPISAALRRQREFTADASHELRTPLTLVRGNAELLLRHPDRPIGDYDDVVRDIVDESDRLGRLVADLLTLARADEGRLTLAHEPVDLAELAAALVREFEPAAAAKGLAIHTGASAGMMGLPPEAAGPPAHAGVRPGVNVWGDRDRLHQLGVILLDNAIRYTEAGSVTVSAATEGHHAVFAVSDTGPGIAAEHLPRLFERFYRTDPARSAEHGGTGLGLAIARLIAEAHGGRIAVTSAPGRGATFTVTLPRGGSGQRATGNGQRGATG